MYWWLSLLIQPHIMAKIRKEFITNPDFDPAKVANASSAAEGLCKWVLAMEIYDRVAKVVAPKKERLKQAEEELATTMGELNQKRAQLREVEEKLANLKQTFQEMTEKKEKLEFQVSPCCFPLHTYQSILSEFLLILFTFLVTVAGWLVF